MNDTRVLRPFVTPSGAAASGPVGREIDRLIDEMRAAFPAHKRIAFERSMADPRNVEAYETGYRQGKHEGFAASFGDFKDRVSDTLDLLYSLIDPEILPDLIAGSIAVYLQPQGSPLPPALKRRFEAALWYQQLQGMVPLLEVLDKGKILETLTMVATEVVSAMRQAGTAWVDEFYALTGNPREQGRHAGYLIGRACGEVFFLAIEEITQVPLFDIDDEAQGDDGGAEGTP